MEQFKTLVSNHFRALLMGFTACLLVSACKKPIENPWTLDPIYNDLVAQSASAAAKVEAQKKKIADLSAELQKYEARDPQLKRTAHEKENLGRGLVQLQQEAQYFEIRAEQRRLLDKENYAKAFKNDLPWPDPSEFDEYQERKKLRTASRNWEDKVPKATQYNKPTEDGKSKKKEEKASGGEGGGEAAPAGH